MTVITHDVSQNLQCFEDIYQTLQKQFYINVPFSLPQIMLEDALQAFFTFLDEPDPIKEHINFTISPLHRRSDVGYRHRKAEDHVYNDDKEFFHFHPSIFEKYSDFLEENPIVQNFMQKAKPIWDLAYQTVYNILQTFEPTFPGTCHKIFDKEPVHLTVRFLKYDWQTSGKYLAKPHFDAGSFTLAIAESCPGLRIGSGPDNLQLVKHKTGNALFMLSSNFQKVLPTQDLSAGWHDVIQLDETIIGKPFARWAIVTFIEAHGVEALPRTETHKWYQN